MSRKSATKAVKTLSKKSNKFLAFLVVVLLITNSMTLYLLLGDVELPFLDSSITSQPSTSSSSSTTQTVIEDRTLMLSNDTCSELRVHYLDILKIGDAIAIECGDIDIIIDAGEKRDGTDVVTPFLESIAADNVVEFAIVTHYDLDHYGGFVGLSNQKSIFSSEVIVNYFIDFGYRKKYEPTEYEVARDKMINEDNTKYYPIQNSFDLDKEGFNKIKIGDNFEIEFLQTNYYDIEADDNDRSITFILTYNDVTFFFGGDITKVQEARLLDNYDLPKINYYKASHHGSYTSNSKDFLDVVNPDYIILNCEEGNIHGIPQKSAVEILDDYASGNIYVTGVNGDITVTVNEEFPNGRISFAKDDTKFIDTLWYTTIMNG